MALAKRGRKLEVKPSVRMVFWVLVELLRDRREPGHKRASASEAARRLDRHLKECMPGPGREMEWETIRDHYKKFERVMRQSNTGEEAELAQRLLDNARQRRNLFGWDTSTWMLVIDPAMLLAAGYEVTITPKRELIAKRDQS